MPMHLTEEEQNVVNEFSKLFFKRWNTYARKWLGIHIVKYPTDLFIYQMIIHSKRPDFIVETGTYLGGSALFFASMCDIVGHGEVLSIDKRQLNRRPNHPRITYIHGRATAVDTLQKLRDIINSHSCMVILDSDHRNAHVKRELVNYSKFVTKGQYLIVEDTFLNSHPVDWKHGPGAFEAVQWFMQKNKEFVVDDFDDHFLITMNPNGFLLRK